MAHFSKPFNVGGKPVAEVPKGDIHALQQGRQVGPVGGGVGLEPLLHFLAEAAGLQTMQHLQDPNLHQQRVPSDVLLDVLQVDRRTTQELEVIEEWVLGRPLHKLRCVVKLAAKAILSLAAHGELEEALVVTEHGHVVLDVQLQPNPANVELAGNQELGTRLVVVMMVCKCKAAAKSACANRSFLAPGARGQEEEPRYRKQHL
mmetsp:Transcript_12626/g.29647  ORF Transcript_12626/g.29647 Transcript_12626/m.29647 type:complete len:203 (+) Transcript_12626:631-1239(+)